MVLLPVLLLAGSLALLRFAMDLLVVVGALALTGFSIRAISDWLFDGDVVSAGAVAAIVLSLVAMSAAGIWVFDRQYPGGHLVRESTPAYVTAAVAWAERHGWGQRVLLPRAAHDRPARANTPLSAAHRGADAARAISHRGTPALHAAPPTSVTLTASAGTVPRGAPVRLTAAVQPVHRGREIPSGTVTFWRGSTEIASAPLRPHRTGAIASVTVPRLPPGSHTITAAYAGNEDHGASRSTAVRLIVTG